MRHRVKKGRKLNRSSGQRRSLMRNLLSDLVDHERLTTTESRAKEVKREFDLLVNLAKRAVLHNNFSLTRKIYSFLTRKETAQKFFEKLLPRLKERTSGYLSIVKEGRRLGDGAERTTVAVIKDDEKNRSQKLASPRRRKAAPGKAQRSNK